MTGLVIIANYSDATVKEITDYLADPADGTFLNNVGIQTVIISYTEDNVTITASFDVTVAENPDIDSIVINGIEIPVEVVDGVAVLKPTQSQMTDILNAPGDNIIFDLSGQTSVDIYAAATWFKDVDKTIIIITDNGSYSVKTKTLWNNSGKQRLITVRNNRLDITNI